MNMSLFIITITFFLFSCNNSQYHSDKTENKMSSNKTGTVNNIKGVWYITSEEIDNVVSKCNVCPKIEFVKNGTGKIIKPSKEKISFTYVLSSGNKIEFSSKNDQQYFDEKRYIYKIHTEDNLEILELSSEDGKSSYVLSREK